MALNLSNGDKLCEEARLSQKFRKALRERRESLILYWLKDCPVRNICVDKQISIKNFDLKICMKFSRSLSVPYRLVPIPRSVRKINVFGLDSVGIGPVVVKGSGLRPGKFSKPGTESQIS